MSTLVGATEPTLGEQLRDDALARVLDHCPPGDAWRQAAVKAIAARAATGLPFEAYTLTLDGLPEPSHHSRWGSVFTQCARAGLIESVGAGRSGRPTVKGSLLLARCRVKPLVVVVGLDYPDARQYVLARRDTRPLLDGAVIVSAADPRGAVLATHGRVLHKVIETPAAHLGQQYAHVMAALRTAATVGRPCL